jgi:hypothetical protein
MDRVSAELEQATVLDAEGVEHRLAEAWAEKPAVLVFLRHFG